MIVLHRPQTSYSSSRSTLSLSLENIAPGKRTAKIYDPASHCPIVSEFDMLLHCVSPHAAEL